MLVGRHQGWMEGKKRGEDEWKLMAEEKKQCVPSAYEKSSNGTYGPLKIGVQGDRRTANGRGW